MGDTVVVETVGRGEGDIMTMVQESLHECSERIGDGLGDAGEVDEDGWHCCELLLVTGHLYPSLIFVVINRCVGLLVTLCTSLIIDMGGTPVTGHNQQCLWRRLSYQGSKLVGAVHKIGHYRKWIMGSMKF